MADLLLCGRFGCGSPGDEATLAALLQELPARLPEARPVVVSADPDRTAAEHGVAALSAHDPAELARAVRRSLLVAIAGTGCFYRTREPQPADPPAPGLSPTPSVVALAVALGRPLGICAANLGRLRRGASDREDIAALDLATTSSVRDRRSLELATGWGVDPSRLPALAADPAFLLTPAADPAVQALLAELRLAPGEPLVVVAPRDPDESEVAPGAWEAGLVEALNVYQRSHSATLLFLPSQIEAGVNGGGDLAICARLAIAVEQPNRARLLQRVLPPDLVAAVLERCEVVLAMRDHAAILALRASVPVVALAADPGLGFLLAEAELDGFLLPPREWSAGALSAALAAATTLREDPRLSAFAAAQRARARIGIERLAAAWGTSGRSQPGAAWLAGQMVSPVISEARASSTTGSTAASRSHPEMAPTHLEHSAAPPLRESLPRFASAASQRGAAWLVLLLPSRTRQLIVESSQLAEALCRIGAAVVQITDPGEAGDRLGAGSDSNRLVVDLAEVLASLDTLAFLGGFALRVAIVSSPANSEFELVATLAALGWRIVYLVPQEHAPTPAGVGTDLSRHLLATADLVVAPDPEDAALVGERMPGGEVVVAGRSDLAEIIRDWAARPSGVDGNRPGGPA